MKEITNHAVSPVDLLQHLLKKSTAFSSETVAVGAIDSMESIAIALAEIQVRLHPKRNLPESLKKTWGVFRFAPLERFLVRVYNLLTQDQKEIAYRITLVCEDLLQANRSLQAKIDALSYPEKPV